MYITKVVYEQREEMADYHLLDTLGVIRYTDYDTNEISLDSINESYENFTGSKEDYEFFIRENIGLDVLDALRNKQVDIVMVV